MELELEYAADEGYVIKLNDAWNKYMLLAERAEIEIPRSFISRRSTFKDKLLLRLGNAMDCVQSLKKSPSERLSLLIPSKFANVAVSKLVNERADTDDLLTMLTYEPQEDIFLSLVHVALKIRRDLMEEPGLQSLSVSEQDVIDCVPDSLYMFLRLLFRGQKLLHGGTVEKEAEARCEVLSSTLDWEVTFIKLHSRKILASFLIKRATF